MIKNSNLLCVVVLADFGPDGSAKKNEGVRRRKGGEKKGAEKKEEAAE